MNGSFSTRGMLSRHVLHTCKNYITNGTQFKRGSDHLRTLLCSSIPSNVCFRRTNLLRVMLTVRLDIIAPV